jgi:hypothetical protein
MSDKEKNVSARHRFRGEHGAPQFEGTWEYLGELHDRAAKEHMKEMCEELRDPADVPDGSRGWIYIPLFGKRQGLRYFVERDKP